MNEHDGHMLIGKEKIEGGWIITCDDCQVTFTVPEGEE